MAVSTGGGLKKKSKKQLVPWVLTADFGWCHLKNSKKQLVPWVLTADFGWCHLKNSKKQLVPWGTNC